jgi:hypothetical protein
MANSITANFAEYYAKEMQLYFEKKAVHRPFVN